MSVRQRGKSWIVDVKVGKERIRRTVRTTKQEARRIEAGIRQELLNDLSPDRGLEDAMIRYIKEYIPHLKDQRGQLSKAKHLRPFLEGKTFKDIPSVAAQVKRLKLRPATINRRLALLRRLCSLAFKEWGWLDQPVAQKVSLLTENNQRHVYLTPKQVDEIASYCTQGASDAIRMASYTGLRRSELLGVGKDNIVNNVIVLGINTKSGRPRTIPVHTAIQDILDRLPLKTTDALLRKEWVAARGKAGLAHVKFHDLRHTWASWMAQAGVSINTIGEILGHSQAQTARRYTHLSTESLIAAVAKVGAQ